MNRLLLAALAPLAAIALVAAACSENVRPGEERGTATTTATGSPEATATATPPASETATPTAEEDGLPRGLREMLEDVAEVRGLEPPPVLEMEVISREELAEVYDSLLDDEDRELAADLTVFYQLIGFIENDQDYLELYESFISDAVLGFYVPRLGKLWVVSDSGALDIDELSRGELSTLAHELIHAVQDHNFDLDAISAGVPDDPDSALAYLAIVEGDAVVFEGEYSASFLARFGLVPVGLRSTPAQFGIPGPILREEFFPYIEGPRAVERIVAELGVERLNELIVDPPESTTQILHPDRLVEGWVPEEVALPDLLPVLGEGWEEIYGGTFGEFEFSNYLQIGVGAGLARAAAEGWSGDSFAVYSDGEEAAAAFLVHFEDATEAAEFIGAHDAFMESIGQPGLSAGQRLAVFDDGDAVAASIAGREVVITFGTDASLAAALLEALEGA